MIVSWEGARLSGRYLTISTLTQVTAAHVSGLVQLVQFLDGILCSLTPSHQMCGSEERLERSQIVFECSE